MTNETIALEFFNRTYKDVSLPLTHKVDAEGNNCFACEASNDDWVTQRSAGVCVTAEGKAERMSMAKFDKLPKRIALEQATKEEFLAAARYAGLAACSEGACARAFWRGVDGKTLTVREVRMMIDRMRKFGYASIDVTNKYWIVASRKQPF